MVQQLLDIGEQDLDSGFLIGVQFVIQHLFQFINRRILNLHVEPDIADLSVVRVVCHLTYLLHLRQILEQQLFLFVLFDDFCRFHDWCHASKRFRAFNHPLLSQSLLQLIISWPLVVTIEALVRSVEELSLQRLRQIARIDSPFDCVPARVRDDQVEACSMLLAVVQH